MFDSIAQNYTDGYQTTAYNPSDPTGTTGWNGGVDQSSNMITPGQWGISPELAAAVGYQGPQQTWGGVDQGAPQIDPLQDFNNYLASKGLHIGTQSTGGGYEQQQLFDANNQPYGQSYSVNVDPDPGNLAMLSSLGMAGGFGAATALGAGAGATGAADAGGGAGAGYAANPYAYPGTLVADASGGLPEGFGSAGFGAGEGAVDGAGGMGLAEGAYPSSLTAGGGSSLGSLASSATNWMQQNPMLTNLAGGAINALTGLYSSNQALNAQQNATNQANAAWAPYQALGQQGLNGISGLLKDPSTITSNPGYQFALTQGQNALDHSAASKGGLYSGAQMKASQRYGQDYASNQYDKELGRYSNAAQLGATGTSNISNNLTNQGNAAAGASLYNSNVIQNGINNALGNFNFNNSMYKKTGP